MRAPLALTPGEPAGIGPDLVVEWAQRARSTPIVVVGDPALLRARAEQLGYALEVREGGPPVCTSGAITVEPIACAAPVVAGKLDVANARYVLDALLRAADGCKSGRFAGLVTGPVQKSVIADSGMPFSGHTEFLAEHLGDKRVLMLLVAGELRVGLVTTHVPLADVSRLVTKARLRDALEVMIDGLQRRFRIRAPRVAVAGLNPHAGEGGHVGREDVDVIAPVCREFVARGVVGPLPADTLFTRQRLEGFDAVLAMYHDQGLPVVKFAGFGEAVNVTLGLSIVRTSVDHGTALDIAGRGGADLGSLEAAIALAAQLAA